MQNVVVPEPRRRPARRPTINDVAAAAGVSRGTVSRVLNGGHDVSDAAQEAVERAMRKTGYVVNQHARSLVTQRSQSVAFILSEPQDRLFEDPNFNVLLHGCTQALAKHDITLLLTLASSLEDRKRLGRYLTGGHVDGALLVSTHSGNPLIPELLSRGLPVVACGKPLGYERQAAYVAADDRDGATADGRAICAPPAAAGSPRSPARWTPPAASNGSPATARRSASPTRALIAHGDYTRAGGEAAMRRLLEQAPDLDAVFVASDLMAAGAITVLQLAGKRIPDDVAVGGFDDSQVALTTQPPLTTVRQPYPRISAEMVRLLLSLIDGESPAAVIVPTELVVRESA